MSRDGERNANWRGGRRTHALGYVMAYAPDHPAAVNGAVLEHRLVAEVTLGRYVADDEVVHHVNSDKRDNRSDNLAVMTQAEHASLHYPTSLAAHSYRRPPALRIPFACEWCGTTSEAIGKKEAGKRFCSRACYWSHRVGGGQLRKGIAA